MDASPREEVRSVHQEEEEAPFPNGIEVPEWSF
jgi:hypothetical protein